MRKTFRNSAFVALTMAVASTTMAGNSDRTGQAGASQLLINPWARSSGLGGANSASVRGLEAQFLNIAGMAFTQRTEVLFANTQWLVGTGVMLNTFGVSQKIGKEGSGGVLGLGVMNMSFGSIDVTTVDIPEGGIGTFTPNYLNIGLSYAKQFSNSINAGITVRMINESISNLSATTVAFDAGVSYTTTLGKRDKEKNKNNVAFAITLKNVGPPMKMSGDGLSTRVVLNSGHSLTGEMRPAQYELPSLLNIGVSYFWRNANLMHEIGLHGAYTANAFSKDQFSFGLEYGFRKLFMIRGGYVLQAGGDPDFAYSALTGPTAGASVEVPISKKGSEKKSTLGIDYSFRATNPFNGVHSVGIRFAL